MGLSNEISFILIFLAVPVQQVKMFCSKLAVRRYLSSSVSCELSWRYASPNLISMFVFFLCVLDWCECRLFLWYWLRDHYYRNNLLFSWALCWLYDLRFLTICLKKKSLSHLQKVLFQEVCLRLGGHSDIHWKGVGPYLTLGQCLYYDFLQHQS